MSEQRELEVVTVVDARTVFDGTLSSPWASRGDTGTSVVLVRGEGVPRRRVLAGVQRARRGSGDERERGVHGLGARDYPGRRSPSAGVAQRGAGTMQREREGMASRLPPFSRLFAGVGSGWREEWCGRRSTGQRGQCLSALCTGERGVR